jgi:hypothetical protein
LLVSTLAVLVLAHCGGGATGANFTIDPEPRTLAVGDQLTLTVRPMVDLSGDLAWEVEEPYGGGLRNSVGASTVYFAPEMAGTYHLTLRADRFDGRPLKQTLAILVLPVPSVAPASAQVPPGGSVAFTATMRGLPRNTVKWRVDEPGGGDIGEDGRYTAPSRPGTYHVTASSTFDPQTSAQATVVVGD